MPIRRGAAEGRVAITQRWFRGGGQEKDTCKIAYLGSSRPGVPRQRMRPRSDLSGVNGPLHLGPGGCGPGGSLQQVAPGVSDSAAFPPCEPQRIYPSILRPSLGGSSLNAVPLFCIQNRLYQDKILIKKSTF